MLTGQEIAELAEEISKQTAAQKGNLDKLLVAVEGFRQTIRTIQPCEMTSLALVGMDAGANVLKFDPFLIQVVRVVDSSRRSHIRQVVSADMKRSDLSRSQFNPNGTYATPIGRLMQALNCSDLSDLSQTITPDHKDAPRGWVRDFRVLAEWSALFNAVMNAPDDCDRLFIVDTLLRNKMFRGTYFIDMWKIMKEHIETLEAKSAARIRIAGFMETTQVMNRYRLAMGLKGIFARPEACYSPVPKSVEEDSYKWHEWARTPADEVDGGEVAKFSAGILHFAKFGRETNAPVYCVDLPWFQADQESASETMAFLLRDAQVGFPVPYVPSALQRAREYAALDRMESHIIQDKVIKAVESALPPEARQHLAQYEFENPGNTHVQHD